MTAETRRLVRGRNTTPTPVAPIHTIADALTEIAREHATLPDTAIDTILWAILPTVHSINRWALYTEIQYWQPILDDPCTDNETQVAKKIAGDSIGALVAQAVGR